MTATTKKEHRRGTGLNWTIESATVDLDVGLRATAQRRTDVPPESYALTEAMNLKMQ